MRQRKAKDLKKRLAACSEYLVARPEHGKTDGAPNAADCFANSEKPLFVEIGCGKGQFITKKAADMPDANFLAIEGQETVILRALEKAKVQAAKLEAKAPNSENTGNSARPLSNLKFMLTFIENMGELFDEGQLSGIYLNFSDPWPKTKHAKRRLTHRDRLRDYAKALKSGGFIEFKTDNDGLFDFTLREIEAAGLTVAEQSRDLHSSRYESRFTVTEYEEKFSRLGKNINYVKITL